jgi:hypothetical protein
LVGTMLNIQHRFNPLHVHCRLVERGLNRHLSASICKWYGILVYSWLARLTVFAVELCRRLKEEKFERPGDLEEPCRRPYL